MKRSRVASSENSPCRSRKSAPGTCAFLEGLATGHGDVRVVAARRRRLEIGRAVVDPEIRLPECGGELLRADERLRITHVRLLRMPGHRTASTSRNIGRCLPLGHGRGVALARGIHRRLDRRHRVDIARAVRKDRLGAHAHDELGSGELREERIVLVHRGPPVHPEALRTLEVDEEQADLRVDEEIAEALEHAVAVVAGKRQRLRIHHADEAGPPALVRAVRAALRVGGGEEEHGPGLDEGPVGVGEDAVDDLLDHPIGEPARVEALLEPSRSVMVHGHLDLSGLTTPAALPVSGAAGPARQRGSLPRRGISRPRRGPRPRTRCWPSGRCRPDRSGTGP